MKILLTGKTGQIGGELKNLVSDLGTLVTVDRNELDLSNPESIESKILEIKPNLIINTAAYTAVDKAEEEPDLAMMINGKTPGLMANAAKKVGAGLIHYSTDYVFDGHSKTPYREEDPTNPLSVYGKTKLAGEKAITEAGIPFLILRTSWIYSLQGKNFLLSMLRLAERDTLRIVDDQIGAPTWSRSVAQQTKKIIQQCLKENWLESKNSELSGIYHLTCQGETSWYGFARQIFNSSETTKNIQLIPIPTSEYPTPATRPSYSRLSNEKVKKVFSVEMPSWEAALKDCINSK
ncbi:MAG: dTDP-4-dehydrorhamnose reductase [Nitrospinota bacterium]